MCLLYMPHIDFQVDTTLCIHMYSLYPRWRVYEYINVTTNWLFNHRVVTLVADKLKKLWLATYCIYFADCIRQPQRKLPRPSINQGFACINNNDDLIPYSFRWLMVAFSNHWTPACIKEFAITTMTLQICIVTIEYLWEIHQLYHIFKVKL